jgi:hypothetical protein
MTITFNLAALLNVLLAAAGVWATLPEVRGWPFKLWRLGLPAFFCTMTSIVMLANTPTPHFVEFMWLAAGGIGLVVGLIVGGRVDVKTDQMWGLIQFERSFSGLLSAILILMLVVTDSAALWLGRGVWASGWDPAAAAALLAGFLDGRAWRMAGTAVRSPHADLNERTC